MNSVKIVKDNFAAVMKSLDALTRDRVVVGISAEHAFRQPEPDDPHPEFNNAEIGYINEFGAPEQHLPARPHLVPGVADAAKDKIPQIYRKGAIKVLSGKLDAAGQAHTEAGFAATSAVKATITNGIAPALSARSIAARKARGRSGMTPLIDTGQYRRNIDFAVIPAKQVKKRGV